MIKQCALFKITQGLLTPRWLSAEMVNINIVIRYMAVIATGTRAKAALVIVGFENLCLPVSILRHPFVFSCVYNVRHQWWRGVATCSA